MKDTRHVPLVQRFKETFAMFQRFSDTRHVPLVQRFKETFASEIFGHEARPEVQTLLLNIRQDRNIYDGKREIDQQANELPAVNHTINLCLTNDPTA
ncbi:hypothetical protein J6590_010778 [Homalodisca vitripennis]|nr:hypothetical protein J6590_010778 [Homalodisca vitripennis]